MHNFGKFGNSWTDLSGLLPLHALPRPLHCTLKSASSAPYVSLLMARPRMPMAGQLKQLSSSCLTLLSCNMPGNFSSCIPRVTEGMFLLISATPPCWYLLTRTWNPLMYAPSQFRASGANWRRATQSLHTKLTSAKEQVPTNIPRCCPMAPP